MYVEGWDPITLGVWTGEGPFVPRGRVSAPFGVSGAAFRNKAGAFTFSVDDDDERIEALTDDTARITVDYQPDPEVDPIRVFSGKCDEISGAGAIDNKVHTFEVRDDWGEIFDEITGWPNPTGGDDEQGSDSAYFTKSGPAETVLRDITVPNLTRLGMDSYVVFPASLGRGSTIRVKIRMHALSERLFPAVDNAGIMARAILQDDGKIHILVTQPPTISQILEESAGIVDVPGWTRTGPIKTRYVVGAGGEGTARYFHSYIDAALEAQYGVIREGFIDARDVDVADPNRDDILQDRVDEQKAEDAPKVSLQAELRETDDWRLGKTFSLGDVVKVRPSGLDVPIQHYVGEVDFALDDASNYCEVSSKVGDWSDSIEDKTAAIVRKLQRDVRDQQRRV